MATSRSVKWTKRICPGCGEEKEYPARSATCSNECRWAADAASRTSFGAKPTALKRQAALSAARTARAELESIKVAWKRKEGARSPLRGKVSVTKGAAPRQVFLEINIPDLHIGKLAWAKETGWEDYDTNTAEAIYWKAFDALLARTSHLSIGKILFIIGNDLLNADSKEMMTTGGTPVTSDTRFQRSFTRARDIMIRSIERLRALAPVQVIMVPGNHDNLAVWHLGDSLECYFHNASGVVIDNTPRQRKYFSFGKIMLMFTHGDKGRRNDYPLLMATEQPEMFGAARHHEIHCGHIHMTKLDEQHGVRVRVLPALCAADDWHSEQGFVGNLRSAEAYIWDPAEGLIGTVVYTHQEGRAV